MGLGARGRRVPIYLLLRGGTGRGRGRGGRPEGPGTGAASFLFVHSMVNHPVCMFAVGRPLEAYPRPSPPVFWVCFSGTCLLAWLVLFRVRVSAGRSRADTPAWRAVLPFFFLLFPDWGACCEAAGTDQLGPRWHEQHPGVLGRCIFFRARVGEGRSKVPVWARASGAWPDCRGRREEGGEKGGGGGGRVAPRQGLWACAGWTG